MTTVLLALITDVLRLPSSIEIGTDITILPTTIRRAQLVSNVMELFLDPLTEQGHEFEVGENITVEGLAFTSPDPDPTERLLLQVWLMV